MLYLIGTLVALGFMFLGAVGYNYCLKVLILERRLIITIHTDTIGDRVTSHVTFDVISREEAAARQKEREESN